MQLMSNIMKNEILIVTYCFSIRMDVKSFYGSSKTRIRYTMNQGIQEHIINDIIEELPENNDSDLEDVIEEETEDEVADFQRNVTFKF